MITLINRSSWLGEIDMKFIFLYIPLAVWSPFRACNDESNLVFSSVPAHHSNYATRVQNCTRPAVVVPVWVINAIGRSQTHHHRHYLQFLCRANAITHMCMRCCCMQYAAPLNSTQRRLTAVADFRPTARAKSGAADII